MAEENILDVEEDGLEQGTKKNKEKKRFSLLFLILKYLLFLVLLGVFVVVVSIFTIRSLEEQYRITNTAGPIVLDTQQTVPEDLDWFTLVGEIRGNLLDKTRKTFIVDVYVGYKPGDQLALQELTRRRVQVRERITLYFNSHYSQDLEGARNFIKIKNELREVINRMMNNKIREVAFNSFQIINF